eukprot:TRINITY_DN3380_c0_g1_i1.p1 TRINITY_DN3380_c0_g1~~TRINITY_DN3380_c0_g1_i1.p1  ORF type:complete len:410 (-),score=87.12 TRINITY_DN3380_c0_g1_i1:54-1283(-)
MDGISSNIEYAMRSGDRYPINLESLVDLLKYKHISSLTTHLKRHFQRDRDYTKSHQIRNKRQICVYYITVDCFKKICSLGRHTERKEIAQFLLGNMSPSAAPTMNSSTTNNNNSNNVNNHMPSRENMTLSDNSLPALPSFTDFYTTEFEESSAFPASSIDDQMDTNADNEGHSWSSHRYISEDNEDYSSFTQHSVTTPMPIVNNNNHNSNNHFSSSYSNTNYNQYLPNYNATNNSTNNYANYMNNANSYYNNYTNNSSSNTNSPFFTNNINTNTSTSNNMPNINGGFTSALISAAQQSANTNLNSAARFGLMNPNYAQLGLSNSFDLEIETDTPSLSPPTSSNKLMKQDNWGFYSDYLNSSTKAEPIYSLADVDRIYDEWQRSKSGSPPPCPSSVNLSSSLDFCDFKPL